MFFIIIFSQINTLQYLFQTTKRSLHDSLEVFSITYNSSHNYIFTDRSEYFVISIQTTNQFSSNSKSSHRSSLKVFYSFFYFFFFNNYIFKSSIEIFCVISTSKSIFKSTRNHENETQFLYFLVIAFQRFDLWILGTFGNEGRETKAIPLSQIRFTGTRKPTLSNERSLSPNWQANWVPKVAPGGSCGPMFTSFPCAVRYLSPCLSRRWGPSKHPIVLSVSRSRIAADFFPPTFVKPLPRRPIWIAKSSMDRRLVRPGYPTAGSRIAQMEMSFKG